MLKLSDREWSSFCFPDIFEIHGGYYNKKPKDLGYAGNIPFYGASQRNNGITSWHTIEQIKVATKTGDDKDHPLEKKIFPGNSIVVTNNGSVGFAYFVEHDFTCTHDVNPLYLKARILNRHLAFFIIAQIEKQRVCFEYARKWRPERMLTSRIMLPVDSSGEPDWEFMEAYMRQEEKKILDQVVPHLQQKLLDNLMAVGGVPGTKWKVFKIKDFFQVSIGKNLDGNKIDTTSGSIPYVTRKETKNGYEGFTQGHGSNYLYSSVPVITIGNETAKPFVQTAPFYTGTKVNILKPLVDMDNRALHFIARCIEVNKERYSYSYSANSTRINEQKILLPVTEAGELNITFMVETVKKIQRDKLGFVTELLTTRRNELETLLKKSGGVVHNLVWDTFFIEDVCNIRSGVRLTKADMSTGTIPFIGASEANNGITAFTSNTNSSTDSNVLGVNYNGSVGHSFYHPYQATFSDDVKRLTFKVEENNKYTLLFLKQCIEPQKIKYAYGYKFNAQRMSRQLIQLPIDTDDSKPAWFEMEQFMRIKETGSLLKYLDHHSGYIMSDRLFSAH